ncbi:MAG: ARMT1-like domain-containing protein, partial [Chloroflexota bacterium]
ELAMDLALTDALLTGFSDVVVLHVKYHPTFVSDATAYDVRDLIERCVSGNHGGRTSPAIFGMGQRLQAALNAGRLRLAPHFYWNSCNFMWLMPQILQRIFDGAQLVVVKGDANYRRIVGDAIWETTTPFAEVLDYFPSPLLALRTLKSDPIVGLPPGMEAELNFEDSEWRVNGKRGVIQLKI